MQDELDQIDHVDIDTLVSMSKMAYSFENWDKVISISDELLRIANLIYKGRLGQPISIQTGYKKINRPIVYYFGYGHLMKGLAYQKLKFYNKAKECIAYYEDLSWLDDSSELLRRLYLISTFLLMQIC